VSELNFSSKLLESAVNEFSRLPGIGKKTALRLVLSVLKWSEQDVSRFGNSIIELKRNIKKCSICNNISDNQVCEICANPQRDMQIICIVENIRDIMSIENTHQYKGSYHVLGGIISPMEGVGPDNLNIDSLIERIETGAIKEVIFALSTTMEGDTTCFYLSKKIEKYQIQVSTIARGVAFGGDLEYTDDVTLGRSIANRISYQSIK